MELIASGRILHSLRGVSSLIVTETKLAIDVETPSEKDALVGESGYMAKASCALDEVLPLVRFDLDLLRKLKEALVLGPKLPKASLTPTPDVAVLGDGQAKEGAAGDVVHGLAIERLDVLGSGCYLNTLADAKLSLEAPAPSVHVCFVCKDQ